MRWTDSIGVLGLAMWVTGLLFLFPKSVDEVNWISRSVGAALWLVGFFAIVTSILVRFSKSSSDKKSR
jgi:hypothetical protein